MYLSNSGEAWVRPHEVFHFKCLPIPRVQRRKRVSAAHGQQLLARGQRMTPRSVVFGLRVPAHWRGRELSGHNTSLVSNDRRLGSVKRLFTAGQPQLDSFHLHSAHDPTLWLVGHPTIHRLICQARRANELSKACTAALDHNGRRALMQAGYCVGLHSRAQIQIYPKKAPARRI